jgi:hypothetical protein
MNTGIYPSMNETQAIWAYEMMAGKRTGAARDLPGKRDPRKTLTSQLAAIFGFLF